MVDILNVKGEPIFDDRIIKMETHTYNPYANTTFGNSDEIRIPIQQQDLYTLPCESFLYIEGRLTTKNVNANTPVLGFNCVGYMFDEIRYELNGVVGDVSLLSDRLITAERQNRIRGSEISLIQQNFSA